MPSAYILSDEIILFFAARRTSKRGCAFASRDAIDKYADTDVLVFKDEHLFSECDPKKTGINFYDKTAPMKVLGALNGLYKRIGGPMTNAFATVPDIYYPDDVAVFRAYKNGIEAVAKYNRSDGKEKKHLIIVGDAQFMKRYGFDFSKDDNSASSRKNRCELYVSFDGKMSAKVSAAYKVESLFEIICERSAENGMYCAIETYDPLINSALIRRSRRYGNVPISVVHKTAKDLKADGAEHDIRREETGVLVRSSRLKLAEAVIWCKRLKNQRRCIATVNILTSIAAFLLVFILYLLGAERHVTQLLLLGVYACSLAFSLLSIPFYFLSKKYFFRYHDKTTPTESKSK